MTTGEWEASFDDLGTSWPSHDHQESPVYQTVPGSTKHLSTSGAGRRTKRRIARKPRSIVGGIAMGLATYTLSLRNRKRSAEPYRGRGRPR